MLKIKKFFKARKGAELVEIILGVTIAVALFTVAGAMIAKTLKDNQSTTINTTGTALVTLLA